MRARVSSLTSIVSMDNHRNNYTFRGRRLTRCTKKRERDIATKNGKPCNYLYVSRNDINWEPLFNLKKKILYYSQNNITTHFYDIEDVSNETSDPRTRNSDEQSNISSLSWKQLAVSLSLSRPRRRGLKRRKSGTTPYLHIKKAIRRTRLCKRRGRLRVPAGDEKNCEIRALINLLSGTADRRRRSGGEEEEGGEGRGKLWRDIRGVKLFKPRIKRGGTRI